MREKGRDGRGDDKSALDHQDLQQCPPGWIVGKEHIKGPELKTKD